MMTLTSIRAPLALRRETLITLVSLVVVLAPVAARANMALNASFETGPDPGMAIVLPVGSTSISGWTVTRNAIEYVGTRWNAADGTRSVALNGSAAGGIAQTIATVAGAEYTVSFRMAGDAFSNPVLKHMRVEAAGQSQDYEFDGTHAWPWELGWVERTFVFTAVSGSATVEFWSLEADSTGPALDQVAITGATVGVGAPGIARATLEPRPNPASRTLTMEYALPAAGPVRLSLFDLQGREVHVAASGPHPAGRYSRAWDRGRAPAGIYFARLTVPGATVVRKVVLSD